MSENNDKIYYTEIPDPTKWEDFDRPLEFASEEEAKRAAIIFNDALDNARAAQRWKDAKIARGIFYEERIWENVYEGGDRIANAILNQEHSILTKEPSK